MTSAPPAVDVSTLQAGGVTVHLEGRGEDTLVFVHGWPDRHSVWDGLVAALAPRRRCARFTLPGFAPGDDPRARSLDEVVATLQAVCDAASPGRPVVLVLHDWGCFFGYRFAERHPDRVRAIVALDIGGDAGSKANRAEMGWRGQLGALAYQLTLATAWRVGGAPGDAVARSAARLFHAPDPEHATAAMGWPYAVQWFGAAGGFGRPRVFVPECPMFYAWGRRKPFAFQSRRWLERIAREPANRVLELDAGHWLMRRHENELGAAIEAWLDTQLTRSPAPC
ncbi:alpha/beta fold hydrolase [Rubrivivax gelatinosus]|uniref:Alpha/beta hydrolase fold n=1 Tax=Rubrivivax gelatinosus (strain NBRC 100245 / IL144) TaxID=983917 RepID=I0HRK1_RUBGI|nr:alpha/beta fold hydrolase [Rubrivivax gelatinosus]BAL95638.1 alpha/beta hydrolase fold [Rubrivivax gelatinosus IL144]